MDDDSILTTQLIRSIVKSNFSKEKKLGVIIIDYLQLMTNKIDNRNNRSYELAQITRDLKNLAREFNLPIVALSQLSRNVEMRNDKKPILADLRESGSIEQDADLVLLLSKSTKQVVNSNLNSNILIDVSIAKHRNGPIGEIILQFDKKRTKFINV
jgi:replicative DNA helicase